MVPQQPIQYPPAPKPKSNGPIILFAVFAALIGSCCQVCTFAYLRAQSPAGKREAREEEKRHHAAVSGFLTKLGRLRTAMADAKAGGTCRIQSPHDLPRVDSYYMAAVLDGDQTELPSSELLRSSQFSKNMLDAAKAEHGGDGGVSDLTLSFGANDIGDLDRKPTILLIRVDDMTAPSVDGNSWAGGELHGMVSAVDWKKETVLCSAPLDVASSDTVKFGGGTRIKVHGVPVGTVGKTDLDDAVNKDFEQNLEAALDKALAR